MATAKKQSKSKSASSSSSKASKQGRSTKTAKSAKTRGAQLSQSADESVAQASYKRAKDFVGSNANLPTAGFALAGAGLLALVSTQAGRNLMKSAAEAVISLVNSPSITDSIPESFKAPFKSDKSQELGSKTDFSPSKRTTGKSANKSAKAQF